MYEAFYNLREKPFAILPDPDYLYFGKRQTLAYTVLEYGVVHGAGFTVITGEVGCGKTTLIRHLLNQIDQDVTVGLISNTWQDIGELLKWVLLAFDQPYDSNDTVALFDQLQRFLISEYGHGRRTVLIIDEAQNLGTSTLEELRMLSSINADKDQLLQMVLVGQPQLKDLLSRRELEQFAQRVSADFHIEPLASDEVGDYIRHRLRVAGREEKLFEDAAIARIAAATGGTPRKINILCDTVLVYGFSQGAATIGPGVVEEVLRDKARFGVMGRQDLPRGAAGQSAAAWVTDLAEERPSRPRDDEASQRCWRRCLSGRSSALSILSVQPSGESFGPEPYLVASDDPSAPRTPKRAKGMLSGGDGKADLKKCG